MNNTYTKATMTVVTYDHAQDDKMFIEKREIIFNAPPKEAAKDIIKLFAITKEDLSDTKIGYGHFILKPDEYDCDYRYDSNFPVRLHKTVHRYLVLEKFERGAEATAVNPYVTKWLLEKAFRDL